VAAEQGQDAPGAKPKSKLGSVFGASSKEWGRVRQSPVPSGSGGDTVVAPETAPAATKEQKEGQQAAAAACAPPSAAGGPAAAKPKDWSRVKRHTAQQRPAPSDPTGGDTQTERSPTGDRPPIIEAPTDSSKAASVVEAKAQRTLSQKPAATATPPSNDASQEEEKGQPLATAPPPNQKQPAPEEKPSRAAAVSSPLSAPLEASTPKQQPKQAPQQLQQQDLSAVPPASSSAAAPPSSAARGDSTPIGGGGTRGRVIPGSARWTLEELRAFMPQTGQQPPPSPCPIEARMHLLPDKAVPCVGLLL